jgi:hypothetical protein
MVKYLVANFYFMFFNPKNVYKFSRFAYIIYVMTILMSQKHDLELN